MEPPRDVLARDALQIADEQPPAEIAGGGLGAPRRRVLLVRAEERVGGAVAVAPFEQVLADALVGRLRQGTSTWRWSTAAHLDISRFRSLR